MVEAGPLPGSAPTENLPLSEVWTARGGTMSGSLGVYPDSAESLGPIWIGTPRNQAWKVPGLAQGIPSYLGSGNCKRFL